jgi:hypothetical protein
MPAQRGPEQISGKPPQEKSRPTRRPERRGLAASLSPCDPSFDWQDE